MNSFNTRFCNYKRLIQITKQIELLPEGDIKCHQFIAVVVAIRTEKRSNKRFRALQLAQ